VKAKVPPEEIEVCHETITGPGGVKLQVTHQTIRRLVTLTVTEETRNVPVLGYLKPTQANKAGQ